MNCAEANQIDMVDYLNSVGYQPQKISGNDYWYLSPLRDEKHASFKVERNKNVWYDHGIGKGGSLIDFLMQMHQCDVREALQKLSFFHFRDSMPQNSRDKSQQQNGRWEQLAQMPILYNLMNRPASSSCN